MLLCIDMGNTNITLGLYEGEALGPRWRLATDHERMPDEFILQLLGLLALAGLGREEWCVDLVLVDDRAMAELNGDFRGNPDVTDVLSFTYLEDEGASIGEVVKALNALGGTPRDLVAIFQAIKAAGALQADLEVI